VNTPRNLRNVWIELDCEGYSEPVARGPRRKDGQSTICVKVRKNGESVWKYTVQFYPDLDNNVLLAYFWDKETGTCFRKDTIPL